MASEDTNNIFNRKTFCVITGASKGFGRCMALTYAKKFPRGSKMLLLARSEPELREVMNELHTTELQDPSIHIIPTDLQKQSSNGIEDFFLETFGKLGVRPEDFEQAMIVHNAASLGDVSKKFSEFEDWGAVSSYFELNLTSMVVLNSTFLKHFTRKAVDHRVVINISSICGLQPFKSWSLYCAGKAARDMLFRTMALEEPDIRVLTYAPGPLNTNMQVEARSITGDQELKKLFKDMHTENKLLSCEESLRKLVNLLEKNIFNSGEHIDYYDII